MDKAKIYSRATALAAAQTPAKKFRFGDLAAILTVAVVGIFVAYHFSPANAAASVRSAAQSFISTDLA